jgi:3D (Asp-Asp-Asp) domain-containing protein
MFAMVKALSVGLCLLSVFGCIFMQPKDYLTAELSVPGDSSVTEITQVTEITKPTRKVTVVATAYCSCKICCGVYAENRPNGIVYTASGAVAKANHTIAVDTSVIPFGTQLKYGDVIYVAEDTGGAIKGNRIDIYFDDHSEALEWGRRTIEIEVIV